MEGGQAGKEKSSVLIASMYFRASVFSALVYYMTNHEVSNVSHKRVGHTSELATFTRPTRTAGL